MSYGRKGDDSDIYVIAGKGPNEDQPLIWECISCDLMPAQHRGAWVVGDLSGTDYWGQSSFVTVTPGLMALHLRLHRAVGQKVKDSSLDRLDAESVKFEEARKAYFDKLMEQSHAE
jgi:hypothetical protein